MEEELQNYLIPDLANIVAEYATFDTKQLEALHEELNWINRRASTTKKSTLEVIRHIRVYLLIYNKLKTRYGSHR